MSKLSILNPTQPSDSSSPQALYGMEYLNAVIYSWRHVREKSIALSENAHTTEDQLLSHINSFQTFHNSYSTLQKELEGLPSINASLSSMTDSIRKMTDRVNRIELGLDLLEKEREKDDLLALRLDHTRRMTILRRKLHQEHSQMKKEVEIARVRKYEIATKQQMEKIRETLDVTLSALKDQGIASEKDAFQHDTLPKSHGSLEVAVPLNSLSTQTQAQAQARAATTTGITTKDVEIVPTKQELDALDDFLGSPSVQGTEDQDADDAKNSTASSKKVKNSKKQVKKQDQEELITPTEDVTNNTTTGEIEIDTATQSTENPESKASQSKQTKKGKAKKDKN